MRLSVTMTPPRLRRLGLVAVAAGCLSACAAQPAPPPETGAPEAASIAVFEVRGETFAVELATPELVEHAERILAGETRDVIPMGTIVYDDAGVNAPWSWHLDPATIEFAFNAIEVCDGLPSHVEEQVVTSDVYCPWSAVLTSIEHEG